MYKSRVVAHRHAGEEVEVPVEDEDEGEMDAAAEEARVFQEEHAKLEAQKQAMLQDQVWLRICPV